MKYRYYITDTFDGKIIGTNDTQIAHDHSLTQESFVLDAQEGKWMIDGELNEIEGVGDGQSNENHD